MENLNHPGDFVSFPKETMSSTIEGTWQIFGTKALILQVRFVENDGKKETHDVPVIECIVFPDSLHDLHPQFTASMGTFRCVRVTRHVGRGSI